MALEILGALIIGLTLGLLGSGGSTITVPILLYVAGHGPKESIAESMAIVGTISAVSAIPYGRARQIHWGFVGFFGVPGMLGALAGSWLGGHAPARTQLMVFGVVLVAAAVFMFRGRKASTAAEGDAAPAPGMGEAVRIMPFGAAVGALTGFVGVGGGFLIVPSLMMLGGVSIRNAIGTSLAIIALNAAIGFGKYQHYLVGTGSSIDGRTVLAFALIGCAGGYLGRMLNTRLNTRMLERTFAVFLLVLGSLIVVSESRRGEGPTSIKAPVVEVPDSGGKL